MTDETNTTASELARFFIYGGLVLDAAQLQPLTKSIESIRLAHGLSSEDSLKFETRARPDHVSIEQYTKAKSAVIEACYEHDATLITYLILHKIACADNETLIGYGLNTILSVFNFKYLEERGDAGVVVVDRLPFKGDYSFLKEKFSTGLRIEPEGRTAALDHIGLFASSCDGASHLSSAVDIVLGAFRFCVNRTGSSDIPELLFPKLARMLYSRDEDGDRYIREYGITTRPKKVRSDVYRAEYDALLQRLGHLASQVED